MIAAILGPGPAPVSNHRPLTPPAFDRVVATCLAKDPDDRWQSAHDLAAELRWSGAGGPGASGPGGRERRGERLAWITAAAAIAVAGAGLAFVLANRRAAVPAPPISTRFQFHLPPEARFTWYEKPAVSPDGTRIAFAAYVEGNSHVYVRNLGSLETVQVPGTEQAAFPFWSPDGSQIGFVHRATLKKVDASGGLAQPLCEVAGLAGAAWYRESLVNRFRGATWNRDGVVVFSSVGRLFRTTAGGGESTPLGTAAEGEGGRFWPQFLPDGRRYLYLSQGTRPEDRAIYVASLDSPDRQRIVASDHNAAYLQSGHLLFVKGGALMAQAFDVDRLKLSGSALVVTEPLAVARPPYLGAAYSVSSNGVMAWRAGLTPEVMHLTWFDRSRAVGALGEPGDYRSPALSPDEQSLAVERADLRMSTRDIWVYDLARGNGHRLTFDPANDFNPTWSPDGSWIAFSSDRSGGVRDVYRKRAHGGGTDEQVFASTDGHKNMEAWSPSGTSFLINYWQGGSPAGLFRLPISTEGAPEPVPLFAGSQGRFAPGGRWLAYALDDEVYVRGLSTDGTFSEGRWQVSTTGGLDPQWRGDGRELFYFSGTTLMAVEVKLEGASFEAGPPRALFKVRLPPQPANTRYVAIRDGQRFLVNRLLDQPSEPIEVLVNGLPAQP